MAIDMRMKMVRALLCFRLLRFGDNDGYDGVTVGMSKCQLGCEGVALSDRPVPPTGQLACLVI